MLARKYIKKLIISGESAFVDLEDKEGWGLTVIDIQRALGKLDDVEEKVLAAKIILREELKELRDKQN